MSCSDCERRRGRRAARTSAAGGGCRGAELAECGVAAGLTTAHQRAAV